MLVPGGEIRHAGTRMIDDTRGWIWLASGVTAWTSYYWRQRLASQDRPLRRRRRRSRGVKLAPVHVVTMAKDEAIEPRLRLGTESCVND